MSSESAVPSSTTYPGPKDTDPLTDDELALLLAIPRAAESTPSSTLFRLPLGPEPSMGFVDATCAEVRSIVARLADTWKSKLADLLRKPGDQVCGPSVGPGTTICIMVEPSFHGIFHLLAFWAIGCTVQFVSMSDPLVAISQLNECDCRVMLCSGFDEEWIESQRKAFNGVIVKLPEEEQAHRLAQSEKLGDASIFRPWPAPQRPTPATILQSSGTTGTPKIMRMSLYYYTIGQELIGKAYLRLGDPNRTHKTPRTHPRLVPVPPYWSSFFIFLTSHLITATPMSFAYFKDILQLTEGQFVQWAIAHDAGAIGCSSGMLRQITKTAIESNADFFQSLFSISFGGSAMDNVLSQELDRLKLPAYNVFGNSELGRLLWAKKAPYTHLRPLSSKPLPLVRPISEYGTDGSRYVELWILAATSLHITHHIAHGGVPIKLEPFPGNGPHKDELAFNLEDVFQELTIDDGTGSGTETVYVHVGRQTDQIRLGGAGIGRIDASLYEATLESRINSHRDKLGKCPWVLDSVQLFGTNLPCTALVIQLYQNEGAAETVGQDALSGSVAHELHQLVEETNEILGLEGRKRVHTQRRTLIVGSNGTVVHGPGTEIFNAGCPTLSITHKRTLKRWENVCRFKSWLEALNFEL